MIPRERNVARIRRVNGSPPGNRLEFVVCPLRIWAATLGCRETCTAVRSN